MNSTIIRHSKEDAKGCKKYFGSDYAMYRSYCAQFRTAKLQEKGSNKCINIRILPVSFEQYKQL